MSDKDFIDCKFVINGMRFLTYYDFYDNRLAIKQKFQNLSENQKIIYKWYVYANIHININFKNAIWDYLNSDEIQYHIHLSDLKKIYHVK